MRKKTPPNVSLVFGITLVICLFGLHFFIRRYPEIAEKKLLKNGIPAEATVVAVTDTGKRNKDQIQMKILLTVIPAAGEPYNTVKIMYLSPVQVSFFQPGAKLRVRYHAKKPEWVAIEPLP